MNLSPSIFNYCERWFDFTPFAHTPPLAAMLME